MSVQLFKKCSHARRKSLEFSLYAREVLVLVLRFMSICFGVIEMRMTLTHMSEAILEILVPEAHDLARSLAMDISHPGCEVQCEGELHQFWRGDGMLGFLIWNFRLNILVGHLPERSIGDALQKCADDDVVFQLKKAGDE